MSPEQEHEWSIQRRQSLIRDLLRKTHQRGTEWLKSYVRGWKLWPEIRDDVRAQWVAGNHGEPGDWR